MNRSTLLLLVAILSSISQLIMIAVGIVAMTQADWGKASTYFLFCIMLRLQARQS